MNRRKLTAGLVAGAAALMGLGAGVAHAQAPAAPVLAESTFTLPLPVPLAVTVTTGPGGAISDVSVDPADTAITVTKDRPGKVSFTADTTGVKVSVKSKGQTQSVSARAGSLAEISGTGGWSGDVFGDGGAPEVVSFTVGGTDTAPTIVVNQPFPVGGVPGTTEVSTDEDGHEVSARVSILFTNTTTSQTRTLSIKVKVENESESDDDDSDESPETHASVKISLGKLRGLPGAAAGNKTWTGMLCDGTMATVTYDVDSSAVITNVVAPTGAEVNTNDGRTSVRFATGERIKIKAKVDPAGLTINVDEKIRCKDAADPTVNSSVPDVVSDDSDHHDDHDGDHQGDQNGGDSGGRHGGDDKKSDD